MNFQYKNVIVQVKIWVEFQNKLKGTNCKYIKLLPELKIWLCLLMKMFHIHTVQYII